MENIMLHLNPYITSVEQLGQVGLALSLQTRLPGM
ncbi:hypothetical protein CLNEO_16950 [Anaerotignum neopropionicum]|uniref:Uncharacterized protein n=1 Tax=Anaerotignum neopropionicum TaxID=36847 RepID=A0A136WF22_9FIRM|nr:hypothetical protein CLNEO_16950 [Anaerotignum neopropionicum]